MRVCRGRAVTVREKSLHTVCYFCPVADGMANGVQKPAPDGVLQRVLHRSVGDLCTILQVLAISR